MWRCMQNNQIFVLITRIWCSWKKRVYCENSLRRSRSWASWHIRILWTSKPFIWDWRRSWTNFGRINSFYDDLCRKDNQRIFNIYKSSTEWLNVFDVPDKNLWIAKIVLGDNFQMSYYTLSYLKGLQNSGLLRLV